MQHSAKAALAMFAAVALGAALGQPSTALARVRAVHHAASAHPARSASVAGDSDAFQAPPDTVSRLAEWALSTEDNRGKPYLIVDKPDAEVFVFDANGILMGSAPALLGSALGDDTAPGVGDLELADIPMDQRTTEAGRFIGHLGPAQGMANVLWVDFNTALSMHPVVTSNPAERRLERLASPDPDERRITHGCINVPARFFREVVHKTFADTDGVIYILPDTKSLDQVFPDFGLQASVVGRPMRGGSALASDEAYSSRLATLSAPY